MLKALRKACTGTLFGARDVFAATQTNNHMEQQLNTTTDPSPMRKRFERSEAEAEEQKRAYLSQLLPWSVFWEADCPGN